MKALADDQRPVGCEKLTGQERYCVRQGSYRVVYKIEDDGLIVTVVKAAHRSEIHR
ncbi:MAG TPA: type II toxin-antitoxin system RelE/ParE family toxin [Candidatus Acetothermia bacterium]|nr:type II toxin-antitoxin system RelE/ParE family toxin [Candidatus Acetothermia bacterium]